MDKLTIVLILAVCGFSLGRPLISIANRDAPFDPHFNPHGITGDSADRRSQFETEPVLASKYSDTSTPGFYHGVASGDPLKRSVIIWTRWTPASAMDVVEIEYRIMWVPKKDKWSASQLLSSRRARVGKITASAENDWTVKIDVTGLYPGQQWVYGFVGPDGETSPTGLTKTSPSDNSQSTQELNYAVLSCSNWGFGYFHAFNAAAQIKDLDFWIHLGDFIYEYGDRYPLFEDNVRDTVADPPYEIVTLPDYRTRYAQYMTDEAVQRLRRTAPMIALWDDHEIANNANSEGATGHQADCPDTADEMCDRAEGNFSARVNHAAKAFLEWQPVRNGRFFTDTGVVEDVDLTQIIDWGPLATVAAFDTRVKARSPAPAVGDIFDPTGPLFQAAFVFTDPHTYRSDPAANATFSQVAETFRAARSSADNTLMGDEQLLLLKRAFKRSVKRNKPWQILATQTVFAKQVFPNYLELPDVAFAVGGEAARLAGEQILAGILSGAPPFSDPQTALVARILIATSLFDIPWNVDAWDGYEVERQAVLDILRRFTNNAVVYSGDSHDSWTFSLAENEAQQRGDKVGINVCVPSVSSPGAGADVPPLHELGFGAAGWAMSNALWERQNQGLAYANIKDRGFVAVRVTMSEHVSEYIYTTDDLFSAASNMDGQQRVPYHAFNSTGGVAPYLCGASMTTLAGERGSLVRNQECQIEFESDQSHLLVDEFDVLRRFQQHHVVELDADLSVP